jgi:hypothetical protein
MCAECRILYAFFAERVGFDTALKSAFIRANPR